MQTLEEQFVETLDKIGEKIDPTKSPTRIRDIQTIDKDVPEVTGVYWIITTMPTDKMCKAIAQITKKDKQLRKKAPIRSSLILQQGKFSYVAYSGTHENIRKRLKEHLFNEGNTGTGKLSCKINTKPFSNYQWHVYYERIDSYELRYAIETWWRRNCGWPPFCLR